MRKVNYYIYLDDVRDDDTWFRQHLNTEHWVPCVVRNYDEVIHVLNHMHDYMTENEVLILDLDHDLGEEEEGYNEFSRTGYDVCKWMVETGFPTCYFHIHSQNAVGAANMRQLLTHYGYKEI